MFNPSRDQARRFFIDAWKKACAKEALTPIEQIAAELAQQHPEYHALLEDPESAERDFAPEDGQINPFLHLSLHLAVHEQLSIDQPPGIRAAYDACLAAKGDRHAALHDVIESLGETIWQSQRDGSPLDAVAYVEAIHRRARSTR
ncbi:DUF1841 family protein [Niveibacterium sp. 24ML]|uniref:DUF1841 family protein n=1 Tax=Niveibacterium sp. 24ML TaxID=2985512 RepID=UPI002272125B|nr:DUF1841 family protein [Niveibacterium sp. 24ML]MCX9156131.1 DUF1841 family protein [Niveibacterium sp. 24ML]